MTLLVGSPDKALKHSLDTSRRRSEGMQRGLLQPFCKVVLQQCGSTLHILHKPHPQGSLYLELSQVTPVSTPACAVKTVGTRQRRVVGCRDANPGEESIQAHPGHGSWHCNVPGGWDTGLEGTPLRSQSDEIKKQIALHRMEMRQEDNRDWPRHCSACGRDWANWAHPITEPAVQACRGFVPNGELRTRKS